MRRILIVSAVLAAFVALPPIVFAQGSPEAGIGEYQENVPGAGGDKPSGGGQGGSGDGEGGSGGGSGGGSSESGSGSGADTTSQGLPPDVVEQFEQQGADGAAAADLAQSNSPGQGGGGGGGQSGSGGQQAGEGSEIGSDGGQSGVGGVVEKVVGTNSSSDSDGMGAALPIILGASALGALLFLFLRRRGLGPGSA
jgi:hypothetical protein